MRAAVAGLIGVALLAGCAEVPSARDGDRSPAPPAIWSPADTALMGAWSAALPAAEGPGRSVTLRLFGSGAATLDRHYRNHRPPVREGGTWRLEGPDRVRVVLDLKGGKTVAPESLGFRFDGTSLSAVEFDTTAWGGAGLTLFRAGPASDAGGR